MKRIEFIAPVEAMRGNLSGKQELEYPLNDNGAYYAPIGKHYAQNYQPRFIGAKRASDNLKYFAVRTKNAVNMTAASRKAMAVLGGAGAIMGAILKDKTSALYVALMNAYEKTQPTIDGKPATFRQYVTRPIVAALRAKFPMISVVWNNAGVPAIITINNPFAGENEAQYSITISDEILVKFWGELAVNPIEFSVDGQKGIAHVGSDFDGVINSDYNILGLQEVTVSDTGYVKLGDLFLLNGEDEHVTISDTITNGEKFTLTDEQPA